MRWREGLEASEFLGTVAFVHLLEIIVVYCKKLTIHTLPVLGNDHNSVCRFILNYVRVIIDDGFAELHRHLFGTSERHELEHVLVSCV